MTGKEKHVTALSREERAVVEDIAKKTSLDSLSSMQTNYNLVKLMVPHYQETAFAMLVVTHLAISIVSLLRSDGKEEAIQLFKKTINDA